MVRLIIWNLFLFLLPFIVTGLWSRWLQRVHPPEQRLRRLATLGTIGALLVLASLISWRFIGADDVGQTYIAPEYKDGEVVPGHFE
jgi:hypothetical protein